MKQEYGRGADIWPPSPDGSIRLEDSFPNGELPFPVAQALQQQQQQQQSPLSLQPVQSSVSETNQETKGWISRIRIFRILRRAAKQQQQQGQNLFGNSNWERIPMGLLAIGLLRYTQPMDWMLVTFFTGYFCVLTQLARSRTNGGIPTVPTLPPQGHVPLWVVQPLGDRITRSGYYRRWLQLGQWIGLIGPLLWLLRHDYHTLLFARGLGGSSTAMMRTLLSSSPSTFVARPLFWLCMQALTESLSRGGSGRWNQNKSDSNSSGGSTPSYDGVPLPIRILIPVTFNAIRLVYLWQWLSVKEISTTAVRGFKNGGQLMLGFKALGWINFAYWSLNLFAFLIPVATLQYLRAYFFTVEAAEVKLHPGTEERMGFAATSGTSTTSTIL